MVGKRITVIFIIVLVFFSVVVISVYMYSWLLREGIRVKSAQRNPRGERRNYPVDLEIENYIVTRLSPQKALLRVYGINKGNDEAGSFPIDISYFSREGRFLGADFCDLLADKGAVLKPQGKFNAEVTLTVPEGTYKITVDISRGR